MEAETIKNEVSLIKKETEKSFDFPKTQWDFMKELTEKEILRLIELEQIRLADKDKPKGEKQWIKEMEKEEKFTKFILKGRKPKQVGSHSSFYYFMRALGSFLKNHKEFATPKVVEEMDKTRTMSYFASPLKMSMTNAGVPAPEVEKIDVNAKRAKDIEKMELMYYDNLSLLISVSNDLLKRMKKLSRNKEELKKMGVKELAQVVQKLVNAMALFKQRQGSKMLVNINLANAKREDYWRAFNKMQEAFEDEQQ